MIYKLVSIKTVIAKVYSDLGLGEENLPVSDMISWASEALEKIRAVPIYTQKVTGKNDIPLLQITNYQARLPLDCHSVLQVAYTSDQYGNTGVYPMKYSTGSFGSDPLTTSTSGYTAATSDVITLVMNLYDYTYEEAITWLNNNPDKESTLNNLLDDSGLTGIDSTSNLQLEYKIVPGYIKTNQETGYLMVSYYAVPTDEYGYPMIPDDESFMEAIYWYINMKLKYIEWSNGRVRDAIYLHAENKWKAYARQAYGRAMMPASADEMETFKNVWLRLIPSINAGDSFYNNINNQEKIKTFA